MRIFKIIILTTIIFFTYFSQSKAQAFITTWETTQMNEEITIPVASSEIYNYTVDWGDMTAPTTHLGTGSNNSGDGNAIHIYASPGIYTVSITGLFPRILFEGTAVDRNVIKSIEQWGNNPWTSMVDAFRDCKNLVCNAMDTPNLANVINTSRMFYQAISLTGDLSTWDVSHVIIMSGMFNRAYSFKCDLSNWDVSQVTDMSRMFSLAYDFNCDLNNWDVSHVTQMSEMFKKAYKFNGDIHSWTVSNVTDMTGMFEEASVFNRDITAWDVSKVTDMLFMFKLAVRFDQNIGIWGSKTANVIRTYGLFEGAASFDQDLGSWDISSMTEMRNMLAPNLSPRNYDQTIIGWQSPIPSPPPSNINLDPTGLVYCQAAAARNALMNNNNWTFVGDNHFCPPTDLMVSNEASDGADLDWTDTQGTSFWEYYWVEAGAPAPSFTTAITGLVPQHPFTSTGMNSSTDYDWYVRSELGGIRSTWVAGPSFTTLPCSSGIVYVDSANSGTNKGSSWLDAFASLQDAINFAGSCSFVSEIWVKEGTYKPHLTDRTKSFVLQSDVEIYGGFPASGNPAKNDRNWVNHPTILSGEINTQNITTDNSYHVLYCTEVGRSAILDGFIIEKGYANGGGENGNGAGLFCAGSGASGSASPSIVNCTFRNLFADKGAAAFNDGTGEGESSPLFESCTFKNNQCTSGTVYNNAVENGKSNPEFFGCLFKSNTVTGYGGGVFNDAKQGGVCLPTFQNTTFMENMASINGGAVYNEGLGGECHADFEACVFEQNEAVKFGGAIFSRGGGEIICFLSGDGCLFEANMAQDGGALYNQSFKGEMSVAFYNSIFLSNASLEVGAMTGNGGAVYNDGDQKGEDLDVCSAYFINCDFEDNHADGYGGAFHNSGVGIGGIVNCISQNSYFGENIANQQGQLLSNNETNNISFEFCAFTEIIDCISLENDGGFDPVTCVDNVYMHEFDAVNEVSPIMDRGNNFNNLKFLDYYGNLRKLDGDLDGTNTIDIGAGEHQAMAYDSPANTCDNTLPFIQSIGLSEWQYMGDEVETVGASPIKVVRYKMALNDNGNALGKVWVHQYRNTNPLRMENGIPYLDRNWKISTEFPLPPGGMSSVTLRFFFTKAEFDLLKAADNNISMPEDLEITKYSGINQDCSLSNNSSTSSDSEVLTQDDWDVFSNGEMYMVELSVNSFSEFYLHRANGSLVLPVELTNFTGKRVNNKEVALFWETATEINNEKFEIWRKLENEDRYRFFGETLGSGMTTVTTPYHYIDANDFTGTSYYRLKQVDFDGGYEWSSVIAVNGSKDRTVVTVFPNPAKEYLTIQTYSKDVLSYALLNLLGVDVRTGNIQGSTQIEMDNLTAGIYWLQVKKDNGVLIANEKILVVKN